MIRRYGVIDENDSELFLNIYCDIDEQEARVGREINYTRRETIQQKMIQLTIQLKEYKQAKRLKLEIQSQTTNRRRNLVRHHVNSTPTTLTTSQLVEGHLRDIETRASSVNSGDVDRHAIRLVGQRPARTAVRRVPRDVERAADERERGKIAERREARRKTIRTIRARDAVESARLVVEGDVVGGAQRRGCGRVGLRRHVWGRRGRVGGGRLGWVGGGGVWWRGHGRVGDGRLGWVGGGGVWRRGHGRVGVGRLGRVGGGGVWRRGHGRGVGRGRRARARAGRVHVIAVVVLVRVRRRGRVGCGGRVACAARLRIRDRRRIRSGGRCIRGGGRRIRGGGGVWDGGRWIIGLRR
jgi:hypothetical protein